MEHEPDVAPGLDPPSPRVKAAIQLAKEVKAAHIKVNLTRRPSTEGPPRLQYEEQCSCGWVTPPSSRRGAEVLGKFHRKHPEALIT